MDVLYACLAKISSLLTNALLQTFKNLRTECLVGLFVLEEWILMANSFDINKENFDICTFLFLFCPSDTNFSIGDFDVLFQDCTERSNSHVLSHYLFQQSSWQVSANCSPLSLLPSFFLYHYIFCSCSLLLLLPSKQPLSYHFSHVFHLN